MKKFIAIILVVLLAIPVSMMFTSATETNIAAGKTYTFTGKYTDATTHAVLYPDTNNTELTDGVSGTAAQWGYAEATAPIWTGLHWKGENSTSTDTKWEETTIAYNDVVVDLTKVENGLSRFVLYSQFVPGVGIGEPTSVEVFVSDDNITFTSAGTATVAKAVEITASTDAKAGIYSYTLTPAAAVSGRYVKFTEKHSCAWTFVSEVEVFQSDAPVVVPVPKETHSLISTNVADWKSGEAVNSEVATVAKSGDAIVVSGSTAAWPYAYYNNASAVTVNIADFNLAYDFTVSGGKTNLVLFCEGKTVEDNENYIIELTHKMAELGSAERPVGDDLTAGTYKGTIKLSDLNYTNATLTEAGKVSFSALKVFTVGGGVVTINKFALESIETVNSEVSGTTPEESEEDKWTNIMGDEVANPGYKLDVTAPENYKAGDTINVTITVKSIVPTTGLNLIKFMLCYDNTKVEPVVLNVGENDEMAKFLTTAPDLTKWENFSRLEEESSRYNISFITTTDATAKTDGSLVIVIPFKVKATATGTIAFQTPHALTGACDYDMVDIFGNGGYALTELAAETSEASSASTSSDAPTGDAGTIAIAIVAMIALAGAATVAVKKRSR